MLLNNTSASILYLLCPIGKMHAVPASLKGKYVIRFTVTSIRTTMQDITRDWDLIHGTATELAGGVVVPTRTRVPLKRK